MDDKTRSLLKKHIRMIDYIRADLVRILGGEEPRKPTDPRVLDPGDDVLIHTGADIKRPLPISPLYQNFEAAKVLPITDAEGRHLDACKCFGCSAKAIDMAAHFPLHGAAHEAPAGAVLVHGFNCPPDCDCRAVPA